jgi:4'-phosphopantetheinyl transferase
MGGKALLKVFALDLALLSAADRARLRGVLDAEEVGRAERFLRPENRDEFIAAHGLKRLVLAPLAGRAAADLRFTTTPEGKPRLVDGPPGLDFNLTHTAGLVACAVGIGVQVGVDAERERRSVTPDVATAMFAPAELAWLDARDGGRTGPSVLALWTLKEAVVKALGKGLALDTQAFTVTVSPPALADAGGLLPPGTVCHLDQRRLDSGHLLALAVIGGEVEAEWVFALPD